MVKPWNKDDLFQPMEIPTNFIENEFPDDPTACKWCKFAGEHPERKLKCPKHNIITSNQDLRSEK